MRLLIGSIVAVVVAAALSTTPAHAKQGCGGLWGTYQSDLQGLADYTALVNYDQSVLDAETAAGTVSQFDLNQALNDGAQRQNYADAVTVDFQALKDASCV